MDRIFAQSPFPRPLALITGAAGGMGRACAHRFAGSHSLVLTDANQGALDLLAEELRHTYDTDVKPIAGDIGDDQVIAGIVDASNADNLKLIVHTAGLSPAIANWREIVAVNLVGTAKLLNAIEACIRPGLVGVFMSSTARCFVAVPDKKLREELSQPLAPGIADRLMEMFGSEDEERGVNAYAYTKWWIHNVVQKQALAWAEKGARILSVSPGFVLTPMTRKELSGRPEMNGLLRQTPVGRWGTPDDIANLVEFLQSDKASFLTGSDIVIDGGLTARVLSQPKPMSA